MAISLKGAVACVTGGGRGIGEATARALAQAGAQVVIGDIDETAAQQAASAIGAHATAVRLDVADPASFRHFIETAQRIGPIDLLVNNAGIQCTGEFLSQDLDRQLREIHINLGGVITGMRLVLPEMVARNYGHIVNISSMAGKMTVPGAAVYSASKFGVASLSRAVRAELVDSRVTLTTVLPAAVQTELTAGLDIRGVPKAKPADVAKEVLTSCQHGPAEITVPRWLAPVGSVEQLLPERLGELIKRRVGAQKRITADNDTARKYQERISRS